MAADDRAGAGVPPPSEGEGSELEDIIHDLRIDAADPLARIRHGTYIEDGLILVAEIDRLRARLAAAAPVLADIDGRPNGYELTLHIEAQREDRGDQGSD